MFEDDDGDTGDESNEIQTLDGELIELSKRFYSKGWGWGNVKHASGKRYRVTGVLEPHPVGSFLRMKGHWVEDPKYGQSFSASSIRAGIMPPTQENLARWVRVTCGFASQQRFWYALGASGIQEAGPDPEDLVEEVCSFVSEDLRWATLASAAGLQALGIAPVVCEVVSTHAQKYLSYQVAFDFLQGLGLTDEEITSLGDEIVDIKSADALYRCVIDGMLPFVRADAAVEKGWGLVLLARSRVSAGVHATLLKDEKRDGNTAMECKRCFKEAATLLGTFDQTVARMAVEGLEQICLVGGKLVQRLDTHNKEISILSYYETMKDFRVSDYEFGGNDANKPG